MQTPCSFLFTILKLFTVGRSNSTSQLVYIIFDNSSKEGSDEMKSVVDKSSSNS